MSFSGFMSILGLSHQAMQCCSQYMTANEQIKNFKKLNRRTIDDYLVLIVSCVALPLNVVSFYKSTQIYSLDKQIRQIKEKNEIEQRILDVYDQSRQKEEATQARKDLLSHDQQDLLALNQNLHALCNEVALIDMVAFLCNIVEQQAGPAPFFHVGTNMWLLRDGLSAYLRLFPKSALATYISEKDTTVCFGLAGICGYLTAKVARSVATSHLPTEDELTANGLPLNIPESVQDDPVFTKRICVFTQTPVRCPIFLTSKWNGYTFTFDALPLLAWCATCEKQMRPYNNPITREPFRLRDLIIDVGGKCEIEKKLEELRPLWDKSMRVRGLSF